ncbi:MAG: ABC transporter substrate-binding protein [Dehalococcoidia bacterium]
MPPVLTPERPAALETDPIEDATRREFVRFAGAGLFAAAFLAACGNDAEDATESATGNPEFPKTVETFLGPVTIEAMPQRVYVVDAWSFDFITGLGLTPVGASVYNPPSAWMTGPEVEATPVEVIAADGPSIENIAAATPDLITDASGFFSQGDPATYQLLQGIAPVVSPPGEWLSNPWRDRFRTLGEALGMTDEVEAQIAETDGNLAAARTRFADLVGVSATFARFNASTATFDVIIGSEDFTRQFLNQELGFTTPSPQEEALANGEFETSGGAAVGVSLERLDLLMDGAELAIVLVMGPSEALTNELVWKQHPLIVEGRAVLVDLDTLLAIRTPTPRAVDFIIANLLPALAQAHAG